MSDESKKPWFPVKRFGYGVGFPIAWEGWLVLSVYASAMALSGLLFSKLAFIAAAFPLTAAFVYIAYRRSDDEWRHRSGE